MAFFKISKVSGEVAERLNAAVLKTAIPGDRYRGFESLPLHHFLLCNKCAWPNFTQAQLTNSTYLIT